MEDDKQGKMFELSLETPESFDRPQRRAPPGSRNRRKGGRRCWLRQHDPPRPPRGLIPIRPDER